jgi:G3E family GTPase
MNEFGDICLDSLLLPQENINFVEINNGSIVCSCLHTDFIYALIEFGKNQLMFRFGGSKNSSRNRANCDNF